MGIEDAGLEASTDRKVTFPGEPGYQGAWDTVSPTHRVDNKTDQEIVRDAAITGADLDQLQKAVERLTAIESPDATTLEALARIRTQIDDLLQRKQN